MIHAVRMRLDLLVKTQVAIKSSVGSSGNAVHPADSVREPGSLAWMQVNRPQYLLANG